MLLEKQLENKPQIQPQPQLVTPPKPQVSQTTTQPGSNQNALLQQLLQHLGVWPTQESSPSTTQTMVVAEEQPSLQHKVPSPGSDTSQCSTPGSPHQPSSPVSPVQLHSQPISPQMQQVSGPIMHMGTILI